MSDEETDDYRLFQARAKEAKASLARQHASARDALRAKHRQIEDELIRVQKHELTALAAQHATENALRKQRVEEKKNLAKKRKIGTDPEIINGESSMEKFVKRSRPLTSDGCSLSQTDVRLDSQQATSDTQANDQDSVLLSTSNTRLIKVKNKISGIIKAKANQEYCKTENKKALGDCRRQSKNLGLLKRHEVGECFDVSEQPLYTASSPFPELCLSPIYETKQRKITEYLHQSPTEPSDIDHAHTLPTSTPNDISHLINGRDDDIIDVMGATQKPIEADIFSESQLEAFLEELQKETHQFNMPN